MKNIWGSIVVNFINYEFVYIFLFCLLVSLILAIFIKNKSIKKFLLSISSVFLCLFIVETLLSFNNNYNADRSQKYLEHKYLNFNLNDKIILWQNYKIQDKKTKKSINKLCNLDKQKEVILNTDKYDIIFNVKYSIYKKSKIRYTKNNFKNKETYIFLGCSFTFGEGLNNEDTLPYYFSEKYNFDKNVLNFGQSARSSNTALNILNSDMINKYPEFKIKHFFYSLMIDHIHRNFRIFGEGICRDDELFDMNGKIKRIKYPYRVTKILFIKSAIFRKIFFQMIERHNDRFYMDYMVKSLIEMDKIVKEKYNSKLTIICWYVQYYSEYLIKRLKESGLDIIFLPECFDSVEAGYRIRNDEHPTAKANKELAEILYNHINGK